MSFANLRRLPPLIEQLEKAARERADGTANVNDEIAAIDNASTWQGKAGDAARDSRKKFMDDFSMSQVDDHKLADAMGGLHQRAVDLVNDLNEMEKYADKHPTFYVDETESQIHTPNLQVGEKVTDEMRKKLEDLEASAKKIRDGADSLDGDLANAILGGTNAHGAITPLNSSGTVVGGDPPDGVIAGTGFWTINKDKPLPAGTMPAGVPESYAKTFLPGTPKLEGPSTGPMTLNKTWADPSMPPLVEGQVAYKFRATGTQFSGQTKMVQVDGKWYQAEWQNYTYEANEMRTAHGNHGLENYDLSVPNSRWTPISIAHIQSLSHQFPDTKFFIPDTCGNNIVIVNGSPTNSYIPGGPVIRSGS